MPPAIGRGYRDYFAELDRFAPGAITVTIPRAANMRTAALADGGPVALQHQGNAVVVQVPLRDVNVLMLQP